MWIPLLFLTIFRNISKWKWVLYALPLTDAIMEFLCQMHFFLTIFPSVNRHGVFIIHSPFFFEPRNSCFRKKMFEPKIRFAESFQVCASTAINHSLQIYGFLFLSNVFHIFILIRIFNRHRLTVEGKIRWNVKDKHERPIRMAKQFSLFIMYVISMYEIVDASTM